MREGQQYAEAFGQIIADARAKSKEADKAEKRALVETIAIARPDALGTLESLMKNGLAVREFDIPVVVDIAAAGPAWVLGESAPIKFHFAMTGTRPTAQPADHVTLIRELSIYLPFGTLAANAEALQRNFALSLYYGDGRKPYHIHMSQLLRTATRKVPSGADTAAEWQIECVDVGKSYKLPARDQLVILPNETERNATVGLCTDGVSAAPTTSTSLKLLVLAKSTVFMPVGSR